MLPENFERPYFESDVEAFKKLVEDARKIADGGSPVLFTFQLLSDIDGKYYEHSIVAYSITEDSSNYYIQIADPNKQISPYTSFLSIILYHKCLNIKTFFLITKYFIKQSKWVVLFNAQK